MIIAASRVFGPDGEFSGPMRVVVEAGRIAGVLAGEGAADIQLSDGFLSPGLIDLHNNGAFGVDFASAAPGEWDDVLAALAARGVTSVLPTVITAPMARLQAAAGRVAAAMARHGGILGLHLEGPFLSAAKVGAHRAAWLRAPDAAGLDELLADQAMRAVLRLVTLAPELPGALAAIERLAAMGIAVSLGHTNANAAEMTAGVDAGARLVTHVFNAQSALSHRAPGAAGVALTDARLFPCLIADGVHVDPLVLKLAFAACERAVAVTDSIALAGLAPGAVLEFGGAPVLLTEQGLGMRADGTIAGAGITLDEAVRRLIAAGVAPRTALAAATSRPAEALGLRDRGRIAVGARADLVWWGDDFAVRRVWTAGIAAAEFARPPAPEPQRDDLHDLDERATLEIIGLFLRQERAAQLALTAAAPALAALVDAVAGKLQSGGRLFYAGAGTSGRLGLLDAVECGPTFGVPAGLIVPVLAGGPQAFLAAAEGAEDDEAAAVAALSAQGFCAQDALVGIAASGATPFTLAALRHAKARGGLTGAIVNQPGAPIRAIAAFVVEIASGPEIIAGSTRLSAGTVQKIALGILSSTVMIRLGKVHGPFMVDMRPSNAKLRRRALRMTADIAAVDEATAAQALTAAGMHVKTAVVMLAWQCTAAEAATRLAAAKHSLRRALKRRN